MRFESLLFHNEIAQRGAKKEDSHQKLNFIYFFNKINNLKIKA
jgi:hypothetical protein